MSQEMLATGKAVEEMIQHLEASNILEKGALISRLENVLKVVTQNQNKLWLRTKSGKPIGEALEERAQTMLNQLEASQSIDGWLGSLSDLETQVHMVNEESRRRGMVVT